MMKIIEGNSFVEFHFEELTPAHLPTGGAVSCSIAASCDGFGGSLRSVWFAEDDIKGFISQLSKLEETRRGSAALGNMSSGSELDPLRFEIVSIDELGRLIVTAILRRPNRVSQARPLALCISFPLDPGHLPLILAEFRQLFRA